MHGRVGAIFYYYFLRRNPNCGRLRGQARMQAAWWAIEANFLHCILHASIAFPSPPKRGCDKVFTARYHHSQGALHGRALPAHTGLLANSVCFSDGALKCRY